VSDVTHGTRRRMKSGGALALPPTALVVSPADRALSVWRRTAAGANRRRTLHLPRILSSIASPDAATRPALVVADAHGTVLGALSPRRVAGSVASCGGVEEVATERGRSSTPAHRSRPLTSKLTCSGTGEYTLYPFQRELPESELVHNSG
jgi:hypothetical protein